MTTKTYRFKPDNFKSLMLMNTGKMFICDILDWEKAKHCRWIMKGKVICNQQGVRFEDYVGITGTRKGLAPNLDMRREHYDHD